MGVYDADTLPVDDDTFLNGGTPPSAPAAPVTPATPAAKSLPTEEPKDEFEANAIDPTPVEKPAQVEEKPAPSGPIETKDVSIRPSAKFETEMQERAKRENTVKEDDLDVIDDISFGVPLSATEDSDKKPHVDVMTPSQAMIPDGMLAENRVKLDEDEEEEKPAETMVPSQAMAESFVAIPTEQATKAAIDGTPIEDKNDDEDNSGDEDDAPVVVGPVISSAGMESLTEEQAENPDTTVQVESMKMEAKIDEEELGESAEALATAETPAEELAVATSEPANPEPTEPETPTAPEQSAEPETKPEEAPKEDASKVDFSFVTQPSVMAAAPDAAPPITSTKDVAPHAKNTHPIAFIILGLVILAVIGLIIAAIIFVSGNKGDSGDDNNATKPEEKKVYSFFLPDEEDGYSLFNSDGKKISKTRVRGDSGEPRFYVRTAILVNDIETNKPGVMDNEGTMLADFGKYDRIYQAGNAFYTAYNDVGDIISKNHKVEKVKILDAVDSIPTYSTNGAIATLEDKKVNVYNGEGAKIFSVDCAKDANNDCSNTVRPAVQVYSSSEKNDDGINSKIAFYYNNTMHVLDASTGKEDVKIHSKAPLTLFDYIKRNNTFYLLGNDGFIFITNGKEVKTESKCSSLAIRQVNNERVAFCEINNTEYYLRDDMSFGVSTNGQKRLILDENTWADSVSDGINFYKDGKLVKALKGHYSFPSNNDMSKSEYYIIRTTCPTKCPNMSSNYYDSYYNADGNKAIKDDYMTAQVFEPETGAAIVTNDRGKNHLIDKNGNKLTSDYNDIYLFMLGDDYWAYEAIDVTSNKVSMLDKNGNVIIDNFGHDARLFDGEIYYVDISDTIAYKKGGEKVLEVKNEFDRISLGDYYISVRNLKSGVYTYYTYSGKEIHNETETNKK